MTERRPDDRVEPPSFQTALSAPDVNVAAMFEALSTAIVLFGADRKLRFANWQARQLLTLDERGIGPSTSIEQTLAPVRDVVEPLLRSPRVTSSNQVHRARLRDREGAEQWIEFRISTLTDGSVLFAAADVTTREHLLVSLERRARELGAIFEVMPSTVRVLDAAGNIARANGNAIREHLGVNPRTLRELWECDKPLDAVDGTPIGFDRHPGMLAISGEVVRARLLTLQRGSDGMRRVFESYAAPVTDAERRVVGAVLVDRDVTEEHRLASELEQQVQRSALLHERVSTEAERLEQMVEIRSQEMLALQESRARERRLSAVGQLAAGVMHDVNNALNPIMAAAYLLRLHADNPDAVRDYADRIAKAAETGAATASRVGRFIRQEPIGAEANQLVDLSVLAEEVLAFMQPWHMERRTNGVHVEILREYAVGVTARGIPGEIREALLNLVQNAIDAMPNGGVLTVSTGISDTEVWIAIADTGHGMPDDVRERAFEPFFTTKGAAGSGLGLAEVYGIARRHRGRAEIESSPGRGARVTMYLPFESASDAPPIAERGAVLSRRVLVVEDHDDGRKFLRQLLIADGHVVEAVSTFAHAMFWLDRDTAPPFDVLVTDIGLPDGNGWELVALARRRWPALRVGVVTGWEPTVLGIGDGAADFILRKPLRAVELLANVAGMEFTSKVD